MVSEKELQLLRDVIAQRDLSVSVRTGNISGEKYYPEILRLR